MRLAIPDLVSSSYFPALAAVEFGLFKEQQVDVELRQIFPITAAAAALREGEIDFLVGPAHGQLKAFPQWSGVKLIAAIAQKMYWFLVVRSDLEGERGDVAALRNVRIGAARGPDLCLKLLFEDAGIDVQANGIEIGPVPGDLPADTSFGVTAADALAHGRIDGFWANGMGAEVAVRQGIGKVFLDPRRGEGPAAASSYTFAAVMTTDKIIAEQPDAVAGIVRGIVQAQDVLRHAPERAAAVGEKLFPPKEAGFITDLVRRDLPFYGAEISEQAAQDLSHFAVRAGLQTSDVGYHDIVAAGVSGLWGG